MSLILRLLLILMMLPMGVYKQPLKQKVSSGPKFETIEVDDFFEKLEFASNENEQAQWQLYWAPENNPLPEYQGLYNLSFKFVISSINQISFFFLDIPPPMLS